MEQIPAIIGWIVMLGCTVKVLLPPAVAWVGHQIERLVIGWAEVKENFRAMDEQEHELFEARQK